MNRFQNQLKSHLTLFLIVILSMGTLLLFQNCDGLQPSKRNRGRFSTNGNNSFDTSVLLTGQDAPLRAICESWNGVFRPDADPQCLLPNNGIQPDSCLVTDEGIAMLTYSEIGDSCPGFVTNNLSPGQCMALGGYYDPLREPEPCAMDYQHLVNRAQSRVARACGNASQASTSASISCPSNTALIGCVGGPGLLRSGGSHEIITDFENETCEIRAQLPNCIAGNTDTEQVVAAICVPTTDPNLN